MLDQLNQFFAGDTMEVAYKSMAIIGTALFLLSTLMTFIGSSTDVDVDIDNDGAIDIHHDTGFADLKIFSAKTIIAFVMFVGWGGIVFGNTVYGFIGAFALGIFMMFVTAYLIVLILKLQESGNINDEAFVGLTGIVYMTIPGDRAHEGKVQVTTKSGIREVAALADKKIETGTPVKIKSKHAEGCFIVDTIDS